MVIEHLGLDVADKVTHVVEMEFGDRLPRQATLGRLVERGDLGKKSGRGFYVYAPGKARHASPEAQAAAGSFGKANDSRKPSNRDLSSQPSDAMSIASPMRSVACMTLFSNPGASMPGGGGSGLSLWCMSISTCAPSTRR